MMKIVKARTRRRAFVVRLITSYSTPLLSSYRTPSFAVVLVMGYGARGAKRNLRKRPAEKASILQLRERRKIVVAVAVDVRYYISMNRKKKEEEKKIEQKVPVRDTTRVKG